MEDAQSLDWQKKQQEWNKQLNKGVRGLFDWITGKRKNIVKRIETDAYHVKTCQQRERDALIFNQLETR
ncbi:hypothetical protein [Nitrosomonas sp. Nm51]|uniref:hypothetical protein n=1 Tax=Nitrosomonas sp. Nm51 TaxID=133720 RepID=UPI000B8050C9|nr:hypothetical protein [Nitrosomonas sp. Nm51]